MSDKTNAVHVLRCLNSHDALLEACKASFHALKSYEYGNSSPHLAKEIAKELVTVIAKAEGRQ